ncbi:MAG TPA: DUF975 family protein [Chitinophagales bacterium]
MAKSNSTLRQEALNSLEGKWGLAIGAFAVYILVVIGISIVPFLGRFASVFISGPFTLGLAIFSLAISRNSETKLEQIFQGFNNFGNAFITYILYTLIIVAWFLLIIIPIVGGIIFFYDGFSNLPAGFLGKLVENGNIGLVLIWTLVILLFAVPAIIASISYSQVFFILADEPEISGIKALNKSKQLVNGYKWKYFLLRLSFIGWVILSLLTLGLGYFALAPYIYVTSAKFYEDRKAEVFGEASVEVIE